MKYAFIVDNRATHAIRRLCTLLEVSPAGYYEWRDRPKSKRAQRDQDLATQISEIFQDSRKTYGSPRVHADLRQRGERLGRKRVARLMRENGLQGRKRRAFRVTTDSNHNGPIAPNLLDRNFKVQKINSHWVGDVTYISTREGWLYLATVLDLASRKVVGWSMKPHMRVDLVADALSAALKQRKPKRDALMFHSDRGSQYASDAFIKLMKRHTITPSMSGKGQCWDNAVAESFFSSLKGELGDPIWENREVAQASIFEYIEVWYNRQRKHSTLGYLSPEAFEKQLATVD